jgi:MoxR-like ATPase
MGYPDIDEEQRILKTNISIRKFDSYEIKTIFDPESLTKVQEDAKKIYVDKKVERYIVSIVDATRNPKKYNLKLGNYIEYGSSPRASIGLFAASKADAMLDGHTYVTPHNVKRIVYDLLRHRLILSYEGQAEGIKAEQIIEEILKKVPVP